MPSEFAGFPAEGLEFFAGLEHNNRREWFQPRKQIFEDTLKQPMSQLIVAVNHDLQRFAPEYVSDPAKAIYRIYRDTRFSNDKTPYKNHIAASFYRRGNKAGAGFYFAVSHKEFAIGGGMYHPEKETLSALRNHFAGQHQQFRKITASRTLHELFAEVHGESLTRTPKGFPNDHPAADLLKLKQCYVYKTDAPEIATTRALFPAIVKHFRAIAPFIEFLNAGLKFNRTVTNGR